MLITWRDLKPKVKKHGNYEDSKVQARNIQYFKKMKIVSDAGSEHTFTKKLINLLPRK